MTDCSECARLRGESSSAFSDYTLRKGELAMTRKADKSFVASSEKPSNKPKAASVSATNASVNIGSTLTTTPVGEENRTTTQKRFW